MKKGQRPARRKRIYHPREQHQCPVCNVVINRKDNLNRHMKKHKGNYFVAAMLVEDDNRPFLAKVILDLLVQNIVTRMTCQREEKNEERIEN